MTDEPRRRAGAAGTIQRVVNTFVILAIFLTVLAVVAITVLRAYLVPHLENEIFVTRTAATATPETYGVPFSALNIADGAGHLQASAVDAGPTTPAILIFHGNAQTIHDWAAAQAYLYHQGMSSFVFDYTGFGASTGKPTVAALDRDAAVAYRAFLQWAGPARRKLVVAQSLGTAVAICNADSFRPAPAALISWGTFSSARDLMVFIGAIPSWMRELMPDLWDSALCAERLHVPLDVFAGENDYNVPPSMGREVAIRAADGSTFHEVAGVGHDAIADGPLPLAWGPILPYLGDHTGHMKSAN